MHSCPFLVCLICVICGLAISFLMMLEDYCRNVHRLLSPDGLFLLKVDAKRKDKADFLTTRFRIIQSWDTHYHGEQRQGPKANFFILKRIPA